MSENSEGLFAKVSKKAVQLGTSAMIVGGLAGSGAKPEQQNLNTNTGETSKPPIVLVQPASTPHPEATISYGPTKTPTPEVLPQREYATVEEVLGQDYESISLVPGMDGKLSPDQLNKLRAVLQNPDASAFSGMIRVEGIDTPVNPQYGSTFWTEGERRPIVKPGADVQKNGPVTYGDWDSFQGAGRNVYARTFLGVRKDGEQFIVIYPDNATYVHKDDESLDYEKTLLAKNYDLEINSTKGVTTQHIDNPEAKRRDIPVFISLNGNSSAPDSPNVIKTDLTYDNILGIKYSQDIVGENPRKISFEFGKGTFQ